MKNFIFFLLLSAVGMTQGVKMLQHWQVVMRVQQIDLAVQQTTGAKAAFARANVDNENALETYNSATAEEREQTLIDAGLLTDRCALYLRDPGALDERPSSHTSAEMEQVAHEARAGAGIVALTIK